MNKVLSNESNLLLDDIICFQLLFISNEYHNLHNWNRVITIGAWIKSINAGSTDVSINITMNLEIRIIVQSGLKRREDLEHELIGKFKFDFRFVWK